LALRDFSQLFNGNHGNAEQRCRAPTFWRMWLSRNNSAGAEPSLKKISRIAWNGQSPGNSNPLFGRTVRIVNVIL
jgi:hypothetical protein